MISILPPRLVNPSLAGLFGRDVGSLMPQLRIAYIDQTQIWRPRWFSNAVISHLRKEMPALQDI
jgi:hypothetical protein